MPYNPKAMRVLTLPKNYINANDQHFNDLLINSLFALWRACRLQLRHTFVTSPWCLTAIIFLNVRDVHRGDSQRVTGSPADLNPKAAPSEADPHKG